jgi:hypothetical protein
MCVAIALSGFLVLMLSGMLSQTLVLSTVSQNQLIAAHAAEELLENARVMTYGEVTTLVNASTIKLDQPITFLVNGDGTPSQTGLRPTSMPVQLDLTDPNTVYGEVNPSSPGTINASAKWLPGFGNYFRGTATETVSANSNAGVSWYEITIDIAYNGGAGNSPNTKKLTRKAYVVSQGLDFHQ